MSDLSPAAERELAALDDALAGRRVEPDLADLGELALLLRDDRPEPDPAFGERLDLRVERGFPDDRGPRSRASGRRSLRWPGWMMPALGLAATAVVFVVIATSLSGGTDDSADSGASSSGASSGSTTAESAGDGIGRGSADAGATADSSAAEPATGSAAEPAPQSVAPAPASGSPRADGRDRRKVERSASMTLAARPRDIDRVSAQIQDVTRQQGGFVSASSVSSSTGGGGGDFQLRIPTRNLDAAMAALSRLAAVRERAQRSEDITAQSVSARSRLKDAKTERKSLLTQLGAATTVDQAAAIRARLRIVSNEIEAARADVRRVDNRAAYATVAVTLVADRGAGAAGATDDDGSWTPGDAARDALRVLEVIAGVALIVLAVALPVALVTVLALVALRGGRRRRREHALDAI